MYTFTLEKKRIVEKTAERKIKTLVPKHWLWLTSLELIVRKIWLTCHDVLHGWSKSQKDRRNYLLDVLHKNSVMIEQPHHLTHSYITPVICEDVPPVAKPIRVIQFVSKLYTLRMQLLQLSSLDSFEATN